MTNIEEISNAIENNKIDGIDNILRYRIPQSDTLCQNNNETEIGLMLNQILKKQETNMKPCIPDQYNNPPNNIGNTIYNQSVQQEPQQKMPLCTHQFVPRQQMEQNLGNHYNYVPQHQMPQNFDDHVDIAPHQQQIMPQNFDNHVPTQQIIPQYFGNNAPPQLMPLNLDNHKLELNTTQILGYNVNMSTIYFTFVLVCIGIVMFIALKSNKTKN